MDLQRLKIDRPRSATPTAIPSPGGTIPFGRWVLRAVVLAIGIGGVALFWSPAKRAIDRFRLPEVEVIRVARSSAAEVGAVSGKAANGYLVAARRAALSADTPGRIVEMLVREGSVVKAGDVVARLYSEEVDAAVRRAEADLEVDRRRVERAEADRTVAVADVGAARQRADAAQAAVASAEARIAQAELAFRRTEHLVESGARRPSDLDDDRAARDTAEADLESARALLEAARSAITAAEAREKVAAGDVEVARAQVGVAAEAVAQTKATASKTIVRAPFDGIVVLKDAEVGEVVSPSSQGGSSARGSVVTMVDLRSLEVQADVSEASLDAVRVGGAVDIFLDAWPGRRHTGRVDRIWPVADRAKATVEVRVVFDELDLERMRPEMGVRIVFRAEGDEPAEDAPVGLEERILIPEDCVVRIDGRSGVFVLERDVARFRPVEIAKNGRRGGRVAVQSGLEVDERIVKSPAATLADGDRVLVKD